MRISAGIIRRITITGILFLLLCIPAGQAEKETVIRAGCPSRSSETIVTVIRNGKPVLFIPGFWDMERITLAIEGSDVIYLGRERKEIPAGSETDLREYAGQTVAVFNANGRNVGNMAVFVGSEVPALFLTVDEKELGRVNRSKDNEITAGRAVYTEADGTVAYEGGITQMKGRGNNTFAYSKKPYQIKLEKKAELSGMRKGKTWVLLANWNDISLIRNQVVMDLAAETGLPYAVGCVQADVWINGRYNGLYLVTEKIQIKKDRMDLKDLEEETEALNSAPVETFPRFKEKSDTLPLVRAYEIPQNPEDITRGYIVVIEKFARLRDYKLAGFRTKKDLSIHIKEPTYPSRAQALYLGGLFNDMHAAVIAEDGISPETGKSYTEYLDLPSFALKFLIEEWSKNYDFIGGSQYMFKDSDTRDPLIYAGPAWDYDLAFGNMRDRGYSPTGDYITATSRKTSNFYWLLSRHPEFRELTLRTWRDTFRPALAVLLGEKEPEEGSRLTSLDNYRERIRASAEMNFARWGVPKTTDADAGGSFRNAAAYLIRWIGNRTAYMDGKYGETEKHE